MHKSSGRDVRPQQRGKLGVEQPSKTIRSRGPFEQSRRPPIPCRTTRGKKSNSSTGSSSWIGPALIGSAAVLGAAAIYNTKRARDAEHKYPPIGRFLEVNGARLHYIDRGQGEPVVLIHGNGSMLQDFNNSGSAKLSSWGTPGARWSPWPWRCKLHCSSAA